MITLPTGTRIWIIAGITDMRCGFNGLASKVQNTLKDDPFSGHIFVFRGRSGSGKMVKILWADRDGLCLFAKRLAQNRSVKMSSPDAYKQTQGWQPCVCSVSLNRASASE